MKTKNNSLVQSSFILLLTVVLISCSLDVKVKNPQEIIPPLASGAAVPEDLKSIYGQLTALSTDQGEWMGMSEHTTDFIMGPTRGTDWDDFGTWRKLHLHTWDATHNQVNNIWITIQQALFQTTLLVEAPVSATVTKTMIAQGKFLRSFWAYLSLDLFGVLQHRPATAQVLDLPQIYTRKDGCEATIKELEGAVADLPAYDGTNRNIATKEAAYFLLAKLYLNKAVFEGDPTKPAGPFVFAPADMQKVINNVELIQANGKFKISTDYWDNFAWYNGTKSTENIFVRTIADGGNMRWPTYMGAHYNMIPSGWNGFVVLSQFYNMYDTINDSRAYDSLPGYTQILGRNAGFLKGLQRGPTTATGKHQLPAPIAPLTDRSGSPLIFTKSASLFLSNESNGYRTNKYPIDPASVGPQKDGSTGDGSSSGNDFVFFRYADALLMKAEALLRAPSSTTTMAPLTADDCVNAIIINRQGTRPNNVVTKALTPVAGITLDQLLAERGKEMYLEAVRRNDLIRFEKFNNPVVERPDKSDPTRCLFPIPNLALSSNPNLKQNPGY